MEGRRYTAGLMSPGPPRECGGPDSLYVRSEPLAEGTAEGAELGVAQQECDLGEGDVRLRDVAERQLAAGAAHEVVEADVEVAQPAVQSPAAHAELGRDLADAGVAGIEMLFDLLPDHADQVVAAGSALAPA